MLFIIFEDLTLVDENSAVVELTTLLYYQDDWEAFLLGKKMYMDRVGGDWRCQQVVTTTES